MSSITTPYKIKKDLLKWVDSFDYLNEIKDHFTKDELALKYYNYNLKFVEYRKKYILLILSDKQLYKEVKQAISSDFLFYMLLEGYSYDTNKTEAGLDPTLAFLPFRHQLDLINELSVSSKHFHVEKSRRQGLSKIMAHFMAWNLIFKNNITMVTTHIDSKSLDMINGDTGHNSVFDFVRWLLDKSIYVTNNWRDDTTGYYITKEYKIVINNNSLLGSILGKSANVGQQSNIYMGDEIEVVCDKFPNLADNILGGISTSVNQMILYTTYRSTDFPFYKIKEKNDTKKWNFFRLDHKDNPTCNLDWYNDACSKLNFDEVLIARELDINPTKSRKGVIWKSINQKLHFVDMSTFNFESNPSRYQKRIGADFGGGSSATALIFAYYDLHTSKLYLVDYFKTVDSEASEIVDYINQIGFKNIDIDGDMSNKFQATSPMMSWFNMFKEQGCHINSINNRNMFETQAQIRHAFKSNQIYISNQKLELFNDLSRASYKNDKIAKDDYSHLSDALQFLYKSIFNNSVTGMMI